MFVFSVRASSIKFILGAFLCVAVIAVMIIVIPGSSGENIVVSGVEYDGISGEEDIVEFIESFGWKVESEPCDIEEVTIPDEFDKVFVNYNEIQKKQGLDLSSYKRKNVTRYTYNVTNYPDYEGTVYINVIIYRSRVIGGDICTASPDGFVLGFDGKK